MTSGSLQLRENLNPVANDMQSFADGPFGMNLYFTYEVIVQMHFKRHFLLSPTETKQILSRSSPNL